MQVSLADLCILALATQLKFRGSRRAVCADWLGGGTRYMRHAGARWLDKLFLDGCDTHVLPSLDSILYLGWRDSLMVRPGRIWCVSLRATLLCIYSHLISEWLLSDSQTVLGLTCRVFRPRSLEMWHVYSSYGIGVKFR